jgi:hypothetical protein
LEEREKVFAPFYRLEGSRNRDTGGVGLGLAVARTIAREHGGDITLATAVGGGLRVRLELCRCRAIYPQRRLIECQTRMAGRKPRNSPIFDRASPPPKWYPVRARGLGGRPMAIESMTQEQLRAAAELAWADRWQIALDMNGDGLVTVSDAWLWLKWFVLAPGDVLLLLLMKHGTSVAIALQMHPQSGLYGFLSALISAAAWLFVASSAIPRRAQ